MSKEDKLNRLISSIKSMGPYIAATLGPGCTFKSEKRPDWVEVHGGRADVSLSTIEEWIKLVKEIEEG